MTGALRCQSVRRRRRKKKRTASVSARLGVFPKEKKNQIVGERERKKKRDVEE